MQPVRPYQQHPSPTPVSMSPVKTVALLFVAALLLAGCGIHHTTAAEARDQAALRQARACVKVMRPVDEQLSALTSRLSVGMLYDDYNKALGSARVTYDRMLQAANDRGGMGGTCIKYVGAPLQGSLNAYIRAENAWTRCNATYGCSIQHGVARQQTRKAWRQGARLANKADAALRWLQP